MKAPNISSLSRMPNILIHFIIFQLLIYNIEWIMIWKTSSVLMETHTSVLPTKMNSYWQRKSQDGESKESGEEEEKEIRE